jgi:hypothetical protein
MNGKKVVLAIGFFGALLVAALYLGLNPGNLAALAIGGAVSTWRNRKRKKRDSAFWSIVWQLRQAPTGNREEMLAELEPVKLRKRVAAILDQDGSNDAVGDVEQFPFPRGLCRLATRAYWTAWGIALTMLLVAAFVPAPTWLRCLPVIVAASAAYGAWLAARRERSYESVIEITPFRVSELFPDGSARTVLFNRYLELHHEPALKRLRVAPHPEDPGIVLDFRRMGFDRMVNLIVEYGQFRPDDSASLPANER